MKKMLAIALAGALTLSLAACGNSANQAGQSTQEESTTAQSAVAEVTPEENVAPESTEETVPATETTEEAAETVPETTEVSEEAEGGNVLVAYFSWSGNTQQFAEMIQGETGADMFVIEPETAYTDDYNALLDVAQQEQSDDARPVLASSVENWDDYDTIFVGYPNWWGSAPMIILSFLEEYDCTGKTIIPFCTSGGGGFGSSVSRIEESAAGATVAEGLHISGSRVSGASADVASWVAELGLAQ